MSSLVTGGAGFIGSHVARHCLELGHEVVVLDDLSGGFRDQVPAGAIFVQGSVTDHELVQRLFAAHRFDYVYHLAAYAAEGLSHFIRRFNYTNNLIGSVNLINEAVKHEVKCFVFTSSIAVYGANQLPMTEDLTPQPEDPYGIAKYAVELDLRAAHEMFGLNCIIFRPHNVYGENQNIGDRYRNVIGIFMNQIMQGQPMTIFGDGSRPGPSATSTTWRRSSPAAWMCPQPTTRSSTSAPTQPTRSSTWPRPWPGPSASRRRSSTCLPATRCSTPTRTTARPGRSLGRQAP